MTDVLDRTALCLRHQRITPPEPRQHDEDYTDGSERHTLARAHCVVTVEGEDVTVRTVECVARTDGWAVLYARDVNGRPYLCPACRRAAPEAPEQAGVAVEVRFGHVVVTLDDVARRAVELAEG